MPHELQGLFKALAHPIRLDILRQLKEGPKCVCEILPGLDSEQSNASQHFGGLRSHGLIMRWKEGGRVMYGIADNRIYEVMDLAMSIIMAQVERSMKAWQEVSEHEGE